MKIIKCYIDTNNTYKIREKSISDLLQEKKISELWGNRTSRFIDTVVLHYISAIETSKEDPFNFECILEIFCKFEVSSHYLINRKGNIYQLVPELKKAWHCGGSIMPGTDLRQGVNDFSIGVELVATATSGFTESQYNSLGLLCNNIEMRWNISTYLGHEDIAGEKAVTLGLRKDIKQDPGNLFNWKKFYQEKEAAIS